jgi:hypothetical protein
MAYIRAHNTTVKRKGKVANSGRGRKATRPVKPPKRAATS